MQTLTPLPNFVGRAGPSPAASRRGFGGAAGIDFEAREA
jgi:hypothetical protein